jgi:hypothetical protein
MGDNCQLFKYFFFLSQRANYYSSCVKVHQLVNIVVFVTLLARNAFAESIDSITCERDPELMSSRYFEAFGKVQKVMFR